MDYNDIINKNDEKIEKIRAQLAEGKNDLKNSELQDKLLLQTKIGTLLKNNEKLFFKINIEDAFDILGEILDNEEEIKKIYIELTSPEKYKSTVLNVYSDEIDNIR